MNYRPKVTIIIPVYNGSNFMSQAIDCAINQTYKNIEILVINDGSTDNGGSEISISGFCWTEGENGEPTIDNNLQSIQITDSIIVGTINNLKSNTSYSFFT